MMAHARNLPIMSALCSMLFNAHYAQNYAGIIAASLFITKTLSKTILKFIQDINSNDSKLNGILYVPLFWSKLQ